MSKGSGSSNTSPGCRCSLMSLDRSRANRIIWREVGSGTSERASSLVKGFDADALDALANRNSEALVSPSAEIAYLDSDRPKAGPESVRTQLTHLLVGLYLQFLMA